MPHSAAVAAARQTMTLVVCVTALVCFFGLLAVVVFVFAPSGRDTSTLVALLFAQLAPTIAALVAVIGVRGVDAKVADVASDTERLANGLGDAKFRQAVAEVVDPRYHARAYRDSDRPLVDKAVVEARHQEHADDNPEDPQPW